MDEEIDVFGGGESPDYQRGWRDGAKHAEGKGLAFGLTKRGDGVTILGWARIEVIDRFLSHTFKTGIEDKGFPKRSSMDTYNYVLACIVTGDAGKRTFVHLDEEEFMEELMAGHYELAEGKGASA